MPNQAKIVGGPPDDSKARPINSLLVLLGRLAWAAVGPVLLVGALYGVMHHQGWLTFWDLFYVLVVVIMLAGRWVEHRSGSATKLTGEPAGVGHFSRYASVMLPCTVAAWVVANVLTNHVLA
jgi:hypothetical protein